jgi:hypothetical protein
MKLYSFQVLFKIIVRYESHVSFQENGCESKIETLNFAENYIETIICSLLTNFSKVMGSLFINIIEDNTKIV